MQTISLPHYPIYLHENGEEPNWPELVNAHLHSKVFVLVDENTSRHCLPMVLNQMKDAIVLTIPSGEDKKNITTSIELWEQLIADQADRNALLLNLGGGVIGDMGGMVASTYKRGISFIQVPTTLLSMVDASVGGKLGIDHQGVKNVIGVFNDPEAIIVFPTFLQTLSSNQLRSGLAEILKHGLIADQNYWSHVCAELNSETPDWTSFIAPSIHIKKIVVEQDPFEKGLRKILNFGHTIGHAVETWSLQHDEQPLLHGEAIAIGMIGEAWLSHRYNGLSGSELEEISGVIKRIYPPYQLTDQQVKDCIELMQHDKKNEGGRILFSLLSGIGHCSYNCPVSADDLVKAFDYYRNA